MRNVIPKAKICMVSKKHRNEFQHQEGGDSVETHYMMIQKSKTNSTYITGLCIILRLLGLDCIDDCFHLQTYKLPLRLLLHYLLTSTYIKDDITLDRLGGVRGVPQFLDITT